MTTPYTASNNVVLFIFIIFRQINSPVGYTTPPSYFATPVAVASPMSLVTSQHQRHWPTGFGLTATGPLISTPGWPPSRLATELVSGRHSKTLERPDLSAATGPVGRDQDVFAPSSLVERIIETLRIFRPLIPFKGVTPPSL